MDDTPRVSADELEDLTEEGASPPEIEEAVILNPDDEDAPSGVALAAARRLPVLFAEPDGFPPATAEALASLSVQRTLVVGDVSSVGDEVMAALPSPRRLAAVSAGGVARLGGLLLLEPGADPDALDAALVGLGLDSPRRPHRGHRARRILHRLGTTRSSVALS